MPVELKTLSAATSKLEPLNRGWVAVVTGVDRGKLAEVGRAPLIVGTAAVTGLRLTDARVSRRHCTVMLVQRAFQLVDTGSRNGTWFDGSRVRDITVPVGALFRIGDSTLVLRGELGAARPMGPPRDRHGPLVGSSAAMQHLYAAIDVAAATDISVVLFGESGSGKTETARAIHQASARRNGPFEVVDCAALKPSLAAAELFGVERGAFTDATQREGAIERAHGGTLFLDEVAELAPETQAALLRAVESSEVKRLGGSEVRSIDMRVIAASHHDLAERVANGLFREDLYYRLEALRIEVPALRRRLEDLPAIVRHLLDELGETGSGEIAGPSLSELEAHAWPGNVRELRNVLSRALAQVGPQTPFTRYTVDASLTQAPALETVAFAAQKEETVQRFERRYFVELMERTAGNVREAARRAGLERSQLKRLLRKHGLLRSRTSDE